MSRDLNDLIPEFKMKIEELISKCNESGYSMRPFYTLRNPFEQGALWRQSRSTQQVVTKIKELESKGAPFLAYCIENVGPQSGRWATNAIPGLSWHQYGRAVDCFWLINENAEWSTQLEIDGINGYRNYTEIAVSLGLFPGGNWKKKKDWPHVQYDREGSPLIIYTLQEINDLMEKKFA